MRNIFSRKRKIIAVEGSTKTHVFYSDQIVCLEIEGLYVKIFLNSGIHISLTCNNQEEVLIYKNVL